MPCIINAANEVAVDMFLNNKISFLEISDIIEKAMSDIAFIKNPSLEDYFETDIETRNAVKLSLQSITADFNKTQ